MIRYIDRRKMKYYEVVVDQVVSRLKKRYPDGLKIGMRVYVPVTITGRVLATIHSKEDDGFYKVRGVGHEVWYRWVRTEDIRPEELYGILSDYTITDIEDREMLFNRIMERLYG